MFELTRQIMRAFTQHNQPSLRDYLRSMGHIELDDKVGATALDLEGLVFSKKQLGKVSLPGALLRNTTLFKTRFEGTHMEKADVNYTKKLCPMRLAYGDWVNLQCDEDEEAEDVVQQAQKYREDVLIPTQEDEAAAEVSLRALQHTQPEARHTQAAEDIRTLSRAMYQTSIGRELRAETVADASATQALLTQPNHSSEIKELFQFVREMREENNIERHAFFSDLTAQLEAQPRIQQTISNATIHGDVQLNAVASSTTPTSQGELTMKQTTTTQTSSTQTITVSAESDDPSVPATEGPTPDWLAQFAALKTALTTLPEEPPVASTWSFVAALQAGLTESSRLTDAEHTRLMTLFEMLNQTFSGINSTDTLLDKHRVAQYVQLASIVQQSTHGTAQKCYHKVIDKLLSLIQHPPYQPALMAGLAYALQQPASQKISYQKLNELFQAMKSYFDTLDPKEPDPEDLSKPVLALGQVLEYCLVVRKKRLEGAILNSLQAKLQAIHNEAKAKPHLRLAAQTEYVLGLFQMLEANEPAYARYVRFAENLNETLKYAGEAVISGAAIIPTGGLSVLPMVANAVSALITGAHTMAPILAALQKQLGDNLSGDFRALRALLTHAIFEASDEKLINLIKDWVDPAKNAYLVKRPALVIRLSEVLLELSDNPALSINQRKTLRTQAMQCLSAWCNQLKTKYAIYKIELRCAMLQLHQHAPVVEQTALRFTIQVHLQSAPLLQQLRGCPSTLRNRFLKSLFDHYEQNDRTSCEAIIQLIGHWLQSLEGACEEAAQLLGYLLYFEQSHNNTYQDYVRRVMNEVNQANVKIINQNILAARGVRNELKAKSEKTQEAIPLNKRNLMEEAWREFRRKMQPMMQSKQTETKQAARSLGIDGANIQGDASLHSVGADNTVVNNASIGGNLRMVSAHEDADPVTVQKSLGFFKRQPRTKEYPPIKQQPPRQTRRQQGTQDKPTVQVGGVNVQETDVGGVVEALGVGDSVHMQGGEAGAANLVSVPAKVNPALLDAMVGDNDPNDENTETLDY